ncbi:ABC transporter ATP-binding protein [Conexibacter sp. S30A1]|uniref:ABC transporter ATP-binding protein n=1 Tax=Conexibacter sp. S30A1 TaxID=2937800 RepID=UPI0020100AD7|nr:ATP-binding cassette domain-containing protein [Conexibacter sp. S30A1]
MSLAALSAVTYTYPGAARPALDSVSLELEPGEFVVLAGLSGSGKSTLLRTFAGLVPHFHGGTFGGEVELGGMSTRAHGPGELAAVVGSLFQDPETQVVLGTPRAELEFAAENHGLAAAEVARAVEETALALAMETLLDRPVEELSGGELQRVALGATLVARPALVCLDEPTSQLDPVAGDELIGLLRRLNEDGEVTVVLAEQRLERCLGACDRVLVMDAGRLVFDGDSQGMLAWALDAAPTLVTPGAALLAGLGLEPVPGVKRARAALREGGFGPSERAAGGSEREVGGARRARRLRGRFARSEDGAVLRMTNVWHELRDGPAILRGVDLTLTPGQRVALMGRNGAGKSTLLRHAAALMEPTRGRVQAAGRVALLLQNPGDYLVHERVEQEAGAGALAAVGLAGLERRHPRDLSGGERQRLALAVVLGDPQEAERPALICLDEPTRGMDRAAKDTLVALLEQFGTAVLIATHDPEFVAAFAQRVVLLADGRVIADGSPSDVLSGGTYFATETARILGGAGGALLPGEAVGLLRGDAGVLA